MKSALTNQQPFYQRVVPDVSDLETLIVDADTIVYVTQVCTMYQFITTGASYAINGQSVVETYHGGTTRWVGIAGQYNYFSVAGSTVQQVVDLEATSGTVGNTTRVIDEDSDYLFVLNRGELPVDHKRVCATSTGFDTRWICISGKNAHYDNATQRMDIAAKTCVAGLEPYPFRIRSLGSKYSYLSASSYPEVASLVFWEIQTDVKHQKDLRFSTIADLEAYVNANFVSGTALLDQGLLIKVYLKVRTDQLSLNTIYAYNSIISNLKTRWQSRERRIVTLENSRTVAGKEFIAVDAFINAVCSAFGVPQGAATTNIKSAIGIPCVYPRRYSLLPTLKAKGKVFDFTAAANPTGKMCYDSVTDSVVTWDSVMTLSASKLYFHSSTVIAANITNFRSFTVLGELPQPQILVDSGSCVRVYRLVDDMLAPRYSYFMVKPIGVDSFAIPYQGGEPRLGILVNSMAGMTKLGVPLSAPIRKLQNNLSFFISKSDYLSYVFNARTRRHPSRAIEESFRFFLWDETSGEILNFTERIHVKHNTAGAAIKLMMDRNVRDVGK